MDTPLHITSEIGKLKCVMLHRPGAELENLTPDTLHELLFDDIPYLKVAQEEHDAFANLLRSRGVEVLYLDQIMFAFLDGDYYDSINSSMGLIENKLAKKAVIVVDDYANEALPGAAKAVDEWLLSHPHKVNIQASLAVLS